MPNRSSRVFASPDLPDSAELEVLADASDGPGSGYDAGVLKHRAQMTLHRVHADEQRLADRLIETPTAKTPRTRSPALPLSRSVNPKTWRYQLQPHQYESSRLTPGAH